MKGLFVVVYCYILINIFISIIGMVESTKIRADSGCSKSKVRWSYVLPGFSIGCKIGHFMNQEI